MYKILVTGGNGQLALAIRKAVLLENEEWLLTYKSSQELDITNYEDVLQEFTKGKYNYCINTAAYTNVDLAEANAKQADVVNRQGAQNLAKACESTNVTLLHVSTDFVFDGKQSLPYLEEDKTNPLGVYGKTKMLGEEEIRKNSTKHFIVRTSWLYSEFGHNFFKSMLKFGKEKDALSVVFDQIGTPTYAVDLARTLLLIIRNKTNAYGTYHYSNEGVASWYDFAKVIFDTNNSTINLKPIRSKAYPLPAKRPSYSVMDKSKIKTLLQINIPHWKDSLMEANAAITKLHATL